MNQAHRGLADTALGLGADISEDISILYAPPAAWSHGYLWGADVVRVPRDAAFSPRTNRILKASHLLGGVEPGPASAYALEIDSPTAVRTLNALMGEGLTAELALAPSVAASGAVLPTGSAIFAADPATKVQLASIGRTNDVSVPAGRHVETTDRADRPDAADPRAHRCTEPRRVVTAEPGLHPAVHVDGPTQRRRRRTRSRASTSSGTPAAGREPASPSHGNASRRSSRPAAGTSAPAPTVRTSSQAAASSPGSPPPPAAEAGAAASSTGTTSEVLPARSPGPARCETRRSWTHPPGSRPCPATMSVDGRFPTNPDEILASGMWLLDAQSASAPGSAVIAHGTTTAGTGTGDRLRHEPALPRRPGARVVDGRPGGLLGRPVGTPARRHSWAADVASTSAPPHALLAAADDPRLGRVNRARRPPITTHALGRRPARAAAGRRHRTTPPNDNRQEGTTAPERCRSRSVASSVALHKLEFEHQRRSVAARTASVLPTGICACGPRRNHRPGSPTPIDGSLVMPARCRSSNCVAATLRPAVRQALNEFNRPVAAWATVGTTRVSAWEARPGPGRGAGTSSRGRR